MVRLDLDSVLQAVGEKTRVEAWLRMQDSQLDHTKSCNVCAALPVGDLSKRALLVALAMLLSLKF